MLGPEIRPQVHNLPDPKPNEDPRGRDAEPLDAGIGALVGITELLLPHAKVFHVAHNLLGLLVDTTQVRLDGLQLLRRLDGAPVLGVGADVDVELDAACGGVRSMGWQAKSVRREENPGWNNTRS